MYENLHLCGKNVAETPRLNGKNVLLVVKETILTHGQHITVQRQGVMELQQMYSKPVSFTSTFQSDTMMAASNRGRGLYKPRGKCRGTDKSLAFLIYTTTKRIFLGWVKEVRTMKS
jgi:hypothetical protein